MARFRKLFDRCRILVCLSVTALLAACAQTPERPYVLSSVQTDRCPQSREEGAAGRTTPERSTAPAYVIHYIEFDDQGWLFPNNDGQTALEGKPERQIDCAFADISNTIKNHDVMIYFYVHGWNHSANDNDDDVRKFRKFISDQASQATIPDSRKVIGVYIAWQGNTIGFPVLEYLNFWSRKNAADRVANGRVREVFSRMRGLRDHWNRTEPGKGENCGQMANGSRTKCKIRTVMIGHSFGGLILFNSTSPYLLETLLTQRDIPSEPGSTEGISRERGIADLIVLLNPAFEAARYEPVHKAAMAYVPRVYEPPLLINITSTADFATKNLFPFVRYANTLLQYPATSDEQSTAMRRTPSNVDRYTTHSMNIGKTPEDGDSCLEGRQKELSDRFFAKIVKGDEISMGEKLEREFCDGVTINYLSFESSVQTIGGDQLVPESNRINPYSLVWNIRVGEQFISSHNNFFNPKVVKFLTSVYRDILAAPMARVRPSERIEKAKVKD